MRPRNKSYKAYKEAAAGRLTIDTTSARTRERLTRLRYYGVLEQRTASRKHYVLGKTATDFLGIEQVKVIEDGRHIAPVHAVLSSLISHEAKIDRLQKPAEHFSTLPDTIRAMAYRAMAGIDLELHETVLIDGYRAAELTRVCYDDSNE